MVALVGMEIDTGRIDEAVRPLLHSTVPGDRASLSRVRAHFPGASTALVAIDIPGPGPYERVTEPRGCDRPEGPRKRLRAARAARTIARVAPAPGGTTGSAGASEPRRPTWGGASVIETTLRRDRLVVAAGLALVAISAWAWTLAGIGMPMPPGGGMAMTEAIGVGGHEPRALVAVPRRPDLPHVVGDDGGDDAAERGAAGPPRRRPPPPQGAGWTARPDGGAADGRVPRGLGRVQPRRDPRPMGPRARRPDLARDDGGRPCRRRRHSAGGRPLPAHPAQASLPAALPLAGGVPRRRTGGPGWPAPSGWASRTAPTASAAAGS